MPLCPSCGSEVAVSDTHCMDCGADLIAAREKERQMLREQSVAARASSGPTTAPVNPASAGMAAAGEKPSEETRIRAFDKQEAERLVAERTTSWVTSGLALIGGLALAFAGYGRIGAGGGFTQIPADLKPAALREGGLTDATVLGVMLLGTGLAAILIGIGQARLAMATTRAINQVKHNLKPEIVVVSTFTYCGLFLLCLTCPPIGFVIGLLLWLGRNPDLKGLGYHMFMVSLAIMVLLGLNMVWKVAENMKEAAPKAPAR